MLHDEFLDATRIVHHLAAHLADHRTELIVSLGEDEVLAPSARFNSTGFLLRRVKAMARHLAVLTYRLLVHGQTWIDRGAAQFERKRLEREMANLHVKTRAKGFALVPIAEGN